MKNYSNIIRLTTPAKEVFNALTTKIPLWWTEMFEGSANKQNETFTLRFGENVYKTMQVQELFDNSKIVWQVRDSLIAVPGLRNKTEWMGTSIVWEIIPQEKENRLELQLTHIGLHAGIECYEMCINGWQQFTNSLKSFLETGVGTPYKQQQ